MVRVSAVAPGSLGAELRLGPGDALLAINGRELVDFLDWEFLAADEAFLLSVRSAAGESIEFDIERDLEQPLGVSLEAPRIRRCANRCDFCFVDGNPEASRKTLFIRDDDYRLSFRHGNFATLSNLKDKDVRRILEYRLSPLYVSVHATDPAIRRQLLRNPKAPAILEQLGMFAAGGIQFHAQIVMVPDVNDGAVLEQSLADLHAMGDAVLTVSVVPVALTAFSKRDLVRAPTRDEAREAVRVIQRWAHKVKEDREKTESWVYGSDELYMLAELPFPAAADYDGFPQVENGVGSVRYLEQLIDEGKDTLPDLSGKRVLVCTGTAMGRLMPRILPALETATGGTFELAVIENSHYGPSVTCAGLLPGEAFRRTLSAHAHCDLALLPAESVNEDGLFVDDVSLSSVEATAPMPVAISYHFTDAFIESVGAPLVGAPGSRGRPQGPPLQDPVTR